MKKWLVTITETEKFHVMVLAETPDEAEQRALDLFDNSDPDSYDYVPSAEEVTDYMWLDPATNVQDFTEAHPLDIAGYIDPNA